jgi:SAM-dependent methyltransferase
MIQAIKNLIIKNQFEPSLIGLFVNPFFIARRGLLKSIKELGSDITGRTLDVGCGTKPYEKYFNCSEYVGLEIETTLNRELKKADYFYDGKKFPFGNAEFDSIVTNQVLEHVFNPDEFLDEINRVLKVGGKLLLTVPFVWDEHEQPYDYARYSSFGLKSLLEKCGFEIIEHHKSVNDF